MKWLAAASVLLACAAVASARCQGPDCPELRSCAKKTFPQQGSIGVVSVLARPLLAVEFAARHHRLLARP